jgi:hypothetical protein
MHESFKLIDFTWNKHVFIAHIDFHKKEQYSIRTNSFFFLRGKSFQKAYDKCSNISTK